MLDWGAEIMARGGGLMREGRGIRDGYGVELQVVSCEKRSCHIESFVLPIRQPRHVS